MAKMKAVVRCYKSALDFLNGRKDRKIGNNTYVADYIDYLGVYLHMTTVVKYYPNGKVTLHSGGHRTVTTKERINCFITSGWGVYQKDYDWYLWNTQVKGSPFDFVDGMEIPSE